MEIRADAAKDFNTPAHHDYRISINPEQIVTMLEVLASAGSGKGTDTVSHVLAPACAALLRLLVILSGLGRPSAEAQRDFDRAA